VVTPRDRRAIVVGTAVILGAVLVTRVVPGAIRSTRELRERAADQMETAARAREAIASTSMLRDSLGRAAAEIVALAPTLTDGGSAAEAQAALSSFVSLVASRSDLRVARLDPVPDSALGAFGRVAVQAELEGDLRGLTRFLQGVEVGDPLLTIASLAVSAPNAVGQPNQPEVLRIEARVEGLYLRRGR
jgi:type II secretion system (T2SS) protein M